MESRACYDLFSSSRDLPMVAPRHMNPPGYAHALKVLDKYRNLLHSLPNVQVTGLGKIGPKFCIMIGVTNKDSTILIHGALREYIEDVPVSVEFRLPVRAL